MMYCLFDKNVFDKGFRLLFTKVNKETNIFYESNFMFEQTLLKTYMKTKFVS